MARRKRLSWKTPDEAAVRKDFADLGKAAKDHLEMIVTSDAGVFGDNDRTWFNLGRQSLARQILEETWEIPETKIVKNLES